MSRISRFVLKALLPVALGLVVLMSGAPNSSETTSADSADMSMATTALDLHWS